MDGRQNIDVEIEAVLDQYVRPSLQRHGGGIRSLGVSDGVYRFELLGKCAGCPSADLTTRDLVREELTQHIPEITEVAMITSVSQDLLDQARAILNHH